MQFPPQELQIENSEKQARLVAFCEYEKFASPSKDSKDWFAGVYVYAKGDFRQYYIAYLKADGKQIRSVCEAGDSFEHAVIIFTARFPETTVMSLSPYGIFLNENIFTDKLSREKFAYKKELFNVAKKLEKLKLDVCNASNAL